MPLSPDEAIKLTDENRKEVDELCRVIDAWLTTNATETDAMTHVPLNGHRPATKIRWAVCRRYRDAGWTGAWFENGSFILWACRKPRMG